MIIVIFYRWPITYTRGCICTYLYSIYLYYFILVQVDNQIQPLDQVHYYSFVKFLFIFRFTDGSKSKSSDKE